MQVHIPSIVTVFALSLFISGTTGCQNTGGPWYNPKSYAWTNPVPNPFVKDDKGSSRYSSSDIQKPSLGSSPNVSSPQGGYTDNMANRSGATSGVSPTDWGQQPPVPSQYPSNPYHTYSDVASSPNPPAHMLPGGEFPPNGGAGSVYSSQQYAGQQNPTYQYRPELDSHQTAQQGTPAPGGYGVPAQYQPTAVHAPMYGQDASHSGDYTPFGTVQHDPYTATVQQQPAFGTQSSPQGFSGYEQQTSPPAYPSGVWGTTPYPAQQTFGGSGY